MKRLLFLLAFTTALHAQVFPPASSVNATAVKSTTDTVNCPNNTTANFASTYSIPANTITSTTLLRVTVSGTVQTTATVPNMAFRMSIGGTQVFAAASAAPTAGFTAFPFGATFLVRGTAAPGASVAVLTNYAGISGSPLLQATNNAASQNLATNGSLVIQPILFCSANTAGNSVTLNQLIVETVIP